MAMPPPPAQAKKLQRLSPLVLMKEFNWCHSSIEHNAEDQGFYFNHIFLSQFEPVGFKDLQGEFYNLGSIWYFANSLQDGFKELTADEMEKKGFRPIDILQREELYRYLTKQSKDSQWMADQEEMPLVSCPVSANDLAFAPKRPAVGSEEYELMIHEMKQKTSIGRIRTTIDAKEVQKEMNLQERLKHATAGKSKVFDTPQKRTQECLQNLDDIGKETMQLANTWRMKRRGEKAMAAQWEKRRKLASSGSLLDRIKEKGKTPIIIVPANPRSLINLQNVQHLLEKGEYCMPNPAIWASRPREVKVTKKIAGKDVEFRVVDSTQKFSHDDWKCAVACIVDGKEWQFKGWPFENYSALFKTMAGIHIGPDDAPNDELVKKWNVLLLQLRRNTRHEDGAMTRKVWNFIEEFITKAQSRGVNFNAKLMPGAKA